jgi:curved DNA-binding protein
MKNYYEILGVKNTATADEIKRAYRRLASQHHPDKGGDVKKFQEIEEAYRTVGDPNKRAQYDNPQQNFGFNFQSNGPFDFDSIFDIFGARFGHGDPRRMVARMSLWITLADSAMGGNRTVSVGTQQGTQAVDIEIPLGIDNGDSVQYRGLAPGGGDLIVTFKIHPNPEFSRQGSSLTTEKKVNVWDLILGGEVTVRDLLGRQLNLNIPPQTQPGTIMRLKGRGMPSRQQPTGDLFVRIQAEIPTNISPELLDQIRQLRN